MQIAGTDCGTCGRSIACAADGLPCFRCAVAFHGSCLTGSACPRCASDLEVGKDHEDEERGQELRGRLATGRVIVLGIIAFLLLGLLLQIVQLALFARGIEDAEEPAIIMLILRFILWVALCAALYWGSTAVKVTLQLVALLGAFLQGLGVWRAALAGDEWLASSRALAFVAMVALFWALTFSRSVEAFLKRGTLQPR